MLQMVPPGMPVTGTDPHPRGGMALPDMCKSQGSEGQGRMGCDKRIIGQVYANRDPESGEYLYVIMFPQEEEGLKPIFTSLQGMDRRLGEPSDKEQGISFDGEIKLTGNPTVAPGTKDEPQNTAPIHSPDASIEAGGR